MDSDAQLEERPDRLKTRGAKFRGREEPLSLKEAMGYYGTLFVMLFGCT